LSSSTLAYACAGGGDANQEKARGGSAGNIRGKGFWNVSHLGRDVYVIRRVDLHNDEHGVLHEALEYLKNIETGIWRMKTQATAPR
jgi:hypothetical protein